MASTLINPIGAALKTQLEAITFTPTQRVYWPAPKRIEKTPALVIDLPTIERIRAEEAEREMGRRDYQMTFGLSLYFSLTDAETAQLRAAEMLELVIARIDAHPTLDLAGVSDARLFQSEPDIDASDQAKPLLRYRCSVDLVAQVAQ